MHSSAFHYLSIVLLLIYLAIAKQNSSSIISKLKTDKYFIEKTLNPKNIYAIDIERIATNRED
jgi:hypothetical protein